MKSRSNRRRILYGVARNTYQRLEGASRYAHDHNWDLCVDTALTWHIPLRWNGDGIIALLAESNPITEYVLGRPEPKVLVEQMMPEIPGPHDTLQQLPLPLALFAADDVLA